MPSSEENTHSEPHKIRHIQVLGAQLAMPEGPLRVVVSGQCCTAVTRCVQRDSSCRKSRALPYHNFWVSSHIPAVSLWGCQATSPWKLLPWNPSLAQRDFMGSACVFLDQGIQTPLLLLFADSLQPWLVFTHTPCKLPKFTSA